MKLTPEERKQLKQEKKIAKKLKLENYKRQIKRDYLERERKYGQLNLRKLEKIWRNMMMEITLPVLKNEFAYAKINTELMIDIKDYQISLLLDELDACEEINNINYSKHVENTDFILEMYAQRLNEVKTDYLNECSILQRDTVEADLEIDQLKETYHEYVKMMTYHLEQNQIQSDKQHLIQYFFKLNVELNYNNEELQILTSQRERTFEKIWNKYKKTLNDHLKHEASINEICLPLWRQVYRTSSIVSEQNLQLIQLKKNIFQIKDQQMSDTEDLDKYLEFRIGERDYLKEEYHLMRRSFDTDRKHDIKQITSLVVTSNTSLKKLEEQAKISESVLKMYSFIRKLETQYEKIFPFPKSNPFITERTRAFHESKYKESKDTGKLQKFWLKYAQSDVLRYSINEEREYLKKENVYLKTILKKYCAATKRICLDTYTRTYKNG